MGRKRRGLSLSEVVVALGLTSIAVFALVSLQLASMRWKTHSAVRQRASLLASSLLDETVSKLRIRFTDLGLERPRQVHSQQPEFEYQIHLADDDLDPSTDLSNCTLKSVEVVVFWKERTGEKSFRLFSRVYHDR